MKNSFSKLNKLRHMEVRYIAAAILAVALLASVITVFVVGSSMLWLLLVVVFTGVLLYTLMDIEHNIFFGCFLLCVFTFLLGGQVINKFVTVYHGAFTAKTEIHADICLLISLIGLAIGFIALDLTYKRKGRAPKPHRITRASENAPVMRECCKILFFCCFPFWVISLVEVIVFVVGNGYTQYYLSFTSHLPEVIRLISYAAPTFLFLFLATLPSKREARLPLILYAIYITASLGTGRRLTFVAGLLIIFAYLIFRNKTEPGRRPWLSGKFLIAVGVAGIVLMCLMYLFEYIRSDSYVGSANQYFPLVGFFVRQGTSINVIKYAHRFQNLMNPDAWYSLYNLLKWVDGSLWDLPYEFGRQSVATALGGTSLADFVSYHGNLDNYLAGIGYGSSYIAELYADFGYAGVFGGNILYGAVFCGLFKIAPQRRNVWVFAVGLCMLHSLFTAPRANFDAFFALLFYTEIWLPVLCMLIVVRNKKIRSWTEKLLNILPKKAGQQDDDDDAWIPLRLRESWSRLRERLGRTGKRR